MRQVDDRLHGALEQAAGDIIEHQRHGHRHNHTRNGLQTGSANGVPDHLGDGGHFHDELEIF